VTLLTGPRQVGKTTLLRHIAEQEDTPRTYVSLDSLEARDLANRDPIAFFDAYPPPIFIDEVQYAPDLFRAIKIEVDTHRKPGDFWLTGSQAFHLMRGIQESLAGRVAILRLSPLSQNERFSHLEPRAFTLDLESLRDRQSLLDPVSARETYARMLKSAMPSLASGEVSNQTLYYESYLDTYIQRDVRDILAIQDIGTFRQFFITVAARTGQVLNKTDMARDLRIHPSTVDSWLGVLETLGLVFFLPPYFNNLLKRALKTPKMYLTDVALACHAMRLDSVETLLASPLRGALFETYVVNEIVHSYRNVGHEPWIYYYRDTSQHEVDVVFEANGMVHPLEIKTTATPAPQLARAFRVLDSGIYPRGPGGVLCNAPAIERLDANNWSIPAALI
jgi:predicted AAA+ superfamily ATPase